MAKADSTSVVRDHSHIAITPYYARGMPADVIELSLHRAKAIVQILESYFVDGGEDEDHAVPVDPDKLRLLVAMIGDHVDVAAEAVGHLLPKYEGAKS